MAEVIKVKGSQAALCANNSHASDFSSATCVRVYNSHTAYSNVTVQTASANSTVATDAVVVGMISVGPAEAVLLRKDPTDEVWGTAATLLGAAVAIQG